MKSLQAAQILSLSVILSCVTSSVFACSCEQKHPQYHYCVSDFVFQAVITDVKEIPKSSLTPTDKPTSNPTMTTSQNISTTQTNLTSLETEEINSTSTENSSLIVDIESTTEKSQIQFEKYPHTDGNLSSVGPVEIPEITFEDANSNYPSESSSEINQYPQDFYIRYRIKVTKVFKGGISIGHADIFTLADLSDCGMRHLMNGTSYLFTVAAADDGRMYVSSCNWVEEYKELTDAQLAGLLKTYGKFCKECNNSEDCSNDPRYKVCNDKYSSCIRRAINQGKFGCTWKESTKHLNCRESPDDKPIEIGTVKNTYEGYLSTHEYKWVPGTSVVR